MLKKLSLVVVTAAMGLGLTACDDRDVAVGAAAVGSAIVVGSVYDNYYGRDYRHSRGRYSNGGRYWDRNDGRYYRHGGRWYRDGRGRDWDRGGRRGNRRPWNYGDASKEMNMNGMNVEVASNGSDFDAAPNRQAAVAAKYRISSGAANAVISSFENIKRYGKLDSLSKIGMLEQDIRRMASGRQPGSASVASIARTLGARTSSVKALILDVNDEMSLRAQGNVTVR